MKECEKCLKCNGDIKQGAMFCSACGIEVKSVRSEKASSGKNINERELAKKHTKAINNGRWAILAIVILCVIGTFGAAGLINTTLSETPRSDASTRMFILISIAVLIIAIFTALWLWAKTRPFQTMLIALCVYSIPAAINFILSIIRNPEEPWMIMFGFFINVIIISVLLKGVIAAYRLKKLNAAGKGVSNE